MKKNISLHHPATLIVIAILVLLSSCYPGSLVPDPYIVDEGRQKENLYYIPSAPNTPLITEKNDIYFNVMRSAGTKFTGVDIQAAYLAGKNIGICASFFEGGNKSYEPDYMNYSRFEAGAGYIKKLRQGWHFETYAGLGKGKVTNAHYTGSSKVRLSHFFVQPAIAVSDAKQTVQLGFSSRIAGVTFHVADTFFSTGREPFSNGQLRGLYDEPFHIMWEPAIVLHAGWKNFLFNAQFTYSADMTNPDLYRSKTNFSLGVMFRFNPYKNIKKNEGQ